MPLNPMLAQGIKSSADPKGLKNAGFASAGGLSAAGGMGGAPYAPMGAMGAMGRGDQNHDYESTQPSAALDGAGEPGATLSDSGQPWLPSTQQNDAPFTVSNVSWGPNTAVFDELTTPEEPVSDGFAEVPERTLEQVDNRWVSPPVIGVDRELNL
jgi:hypothetical protein